MDRLISVIVPVYNVEDYLEECLESIIHQTYKNLEILIVDDGSTDSSCKIYSEYEKKDNRIRVIKKKNEGLSSARNEGLQHAHGEYIGFVDSDDYIDLNMYERLLAACENNRSPIAVCHAVAFKDGKSPIESLGYIKKDYCTSDKTIIFRNALTMSQSVCNKLFHRKLFKGIYFPVGRVIEDGYILYDLLYRAKKVSYVAMCGYYYRKREESITSRKYQKRDADFVLCTVRTYYRVKKLIPELWEDGIYHVVKVGFLPVLKKIMVLNLKEFLMVYGSFFSIRNALLYIMDDLAKSKRISEETKEYINIFIDKPLALYKKIRKSDIVIDDERSSRLSAYEGLMQQWDENRNLSKKITDYFAKNNIKTIAIYGIGTLGEKLYNEIKDTDVETKCFIDRSADTYTYGIGDAALIKPEQIKDMEVVDAVVVTPIHVFDSILKSVRENGYEGKIISLETVVYNL